MFDNFPLNQKLK